MLGEIGEFINRLWWYPRQQMSCHPQQIEVLTPEDKYKNDCLHPCIRYYEDGLFGYRYWMVQSPLPSWSNNLENPILYRSNEIENIGKSGVVLRETPLNKGYNSDPYIFRDGNRLYVFWREVESEYCASKGQMMIVRGIYTDDGESFSEPIDYVMNDTLDYDFTQCPILIKHGDEYLFYAAWYQYEPKRKNQGVAIWHGTSLIQPNFKLEKCELAAPFTMNKWKQIKLGGRLWFIPKLHCFDLWHFDLFEKDGKLYMVACEEKKDHLMLAVSKDWKHFRFDFVPLVLNHVMENTCHYRQYYYKPTAFIKDGMMHFFYTTESGGKHTLFCNKLKM